MKKLEQLLREHQRQRDERDTERAQQKGVKEYLDKMRQMDDKSLIQTLEAAMEHGSTNWDNYLSPNRCIEVFIEDGGHD